MFFQFFFTIVVSLSRNGSSNECMKVERVDSSCFSTVSTSWPWPPTTANQQYLHVQLHHQSLFQIGYLMIIIEVLPHETVLTWFDAQLQQKRGQSANGPAILKMSFVNITTPQFRNVAARQGAEECVQCLHRVSVFLSRMNEFVGMMHDYSRCLFFINLLINLYGPNVTNFYFDPCILVQKAVCKYHKRALLPTQVSFATPTFALRKEMQSKSTGRVMTCTQNRN